MRVIVGLGNPDREFIKNRHNFGFMVVDHLAQRERLNFQPGKGEYLSASGEGYSLFKPTTYMNASGRVVKQIMELYNPEYEELLVVYDDIDLPLGRIRLRPEGSSGGHKGMESIIFQLGNDRFPRLRLGIGPQPEGVPAEDWVLSDFSKNEEPLLERTIQMAGDCILDWLQQPIEQVMNKYNSRMIELEDVV